MSLEKNEEIRTTQNKKKLNKGPYLLGETLGEGAFAKVRLATQIHIKEKCAIKIVDKRLLEGTKDIQRIKKEIKIFKSIRHKNIIQLFDIMESKTNLYFVMEYCKGGELFDYIVKNKRLKENEACVFFQQIINGVEYLHNQGIIHRDLKPENLLLDYKNNIKISDFGLSTFFSKNNYLQTACGTPHYAPPEMLEGLQYNGETSDIWSCGIILYAMLCGNLPFSESKEEIIVQKIKTHDYIIPDYLSKEAQDILYHILKINPEERFTIDKIKQHPWFNLVKPHLMKGITLNKIKIPVDDNILNMVQDYGFDKEECRKLLLNNKFCSLTSIYYLCLKKFVREGGKSISDLESDLFVEYVNDPNNYLQENINEENKENKNDNNKQDKNEVKNDIEIETKINKIPEEKKQNIKENIIIKKENININVNKNINSPNRTKEKINSNKNDIKTIFVKNNQPTSQKKNQNNKMTKKNLLTNQSNKKNNKNNIKNNLVVQEKKTKLEENNKNTNGQVESKIKNNDPKINSPSSIKTKNFTGVKQQQNNINTIIIKKKTINKKQNYLQNQLNTEMVKSPDRFKGNKNKIISNSLVNSFIGKNKSLENDNHKINKIEKIKFNKNIKNNKNKNNNIKLLDKNPKVKKINHSNTITNNKINNITSSENNKILSPNKMVNSNISISPPKEPNKNITSTQNLLNNNSSTPLDQNELDKNVVENKILDEQKPLNIINYIAKKLVSSSFCGSFNLQYASAKKFNSGRVLSATANNHNQLISNGTLHFNRDSNPINEEIEFNQENNLNDSNEIDKDKVKEKNENNISDTKENNNGNYNDNFYFQNLISILNQKFKKYAQNYESQDKALLDEIKSVNIDDTNNYITAESIKLKNKNQKPNIITISNQKTKKISIDKSNLLNKNNINNDDISKNIYAKKIVFKEDTDFKSLDNKKNKNIHKDLSPKNNNIETISYNIKNMTSHYNNFLEMSTNYDPGIDSRGGSSVERTNSFNKNELKSFSQSLDKKNKKDINNKNKGNNLLFGKNNFYEHENKRYKEDNINEDDKSIKNKNINKNAKNKYLPFYEKKVSINLTNTFSNLSKSENKNKKKI